MLQLSTESSSLIALKLEGIPNGTVNNTIELRFTNQYTQEVTLYFPLTFPTTTTGRATSMTINELTEYSVGTYIIDFLLYDPIKSTEILATQLAYISGTDVIGEGDYKTYTTGDGQPDVVYPNT